MAHRSLELAQAIVDAGDDEERFLAALRQYHEEVRADALLSVCGIDAPEGTDVLLQNDATIKRHREAIQNCIRRLILGDDEHPTGS